MTEKDLAHGQVSAAEAEEEVIKMAKRLALYHHYTAEVLVDMLGREKGVELLEEIIRRYGVESGITAKRRVEELGLPLTAENFNAGSDLPKWGWHGDKVLCDDGVTRDRMNYCPLAEVWKEKGSEQLGRVYCSIDQAKFGSYNNLECNHLKNVLDGDDCCVFDIRKKENSAK